MHFFAPRSNHHWWSLDSETLRKGKMGLRAGIQKWITWKNFWLSFFLTKWILSMPSSFVFKSLSPFSSDWLDKLNFLLITRLTSGFYFLYIYNSSSLPIFTNGSSKWSLITLTRASKSDTRKWIISRIFEVNCQTLLTGGELSIKKTLLNQFVNLLISSIKNSTNQESAIQPEVMRFF